MFTSSFFLALRRALATASMAATSVTVDGPLFLVDYLMRLLRVLVLLALWREILSRQPAVSGLTLSAVLTYTLIAAAFAEQVNPRTELDTAFWLGTLPVTMLQPVSLIAHFAADMCGRWLPGLVLFTVPVLGIAPLLHASPSPASWRSGLLFVPSLACGVSVGMAIEFFFGGLTVSLDQGYWVIARIRTALVTLLAGTVVPLALLPWHLGDVIAWLPFASVASAPLQVYIGVAHPERLIALQLAWSAALWPLTLWIWRANRERMVSYGG